MLAFQGNLSGGNLSEVELVRGEVVQTGTCPQGHLSGGNLSASHGEYVGGNVDNAPPNQILFLTNLPEETNEMMLSMLFNQVDIIQIFIC